MRYRAAIVYKAVTAVSSTVVTVLPRGGLEQCLSSILHGADADADADAVGRPRHCDAPKRWR
jgi:hypothetical protein